MATAVHKHAYGKARVSPQRRVVAETIERMDRAFTVEQLAKAVRRREKVGIATLYRAVTALEESGWVARVGTSGGSALFARCSREDHHHHLVCTECGRVIQTRCPLDRKAIQAAGRSGFEVTDHEITLYGLCSKCRVAPKKAG